MLIGIIKNGKEIIGECLLDEVVISYNKTKTVICNGIKANAQDKVIYSCRSCGKKRIECIRGFRANNCNETCQKCRIKNTCLDKYGVESTNQLPEVKRKQQGTEKEYVIGNNYRENKSSSPEELSKLRSKITKERWEMGVYENSNFSEGLKNRWKDKEFRDKMIKILSSEERKKKTSIDSKKQWKKNYEKMLAGLLKSCKHRFSKFHKKIEEMLNLKHLGFVRDGRIDKYIADEINYDKKIIIEANGDYVHANPKKYKPEDIILLPGNKYTAKEKWDRDNDRTKFLESIGFKVVILWESDTDEEIFEKVKNIL